MATLVAGGLLGLYSGSVAWKRESKARKRETLRSAYVAYLGALGQARDVISHASREAEPKRSETAWSATRLHDVYGRQYALELVAPQSVRDRTPEVNDKLVEYRTVVLDGAQWGSDEVTAARAALRDARATLMEAMRTDLTSAAS